MSIKSSAPPEPRSDEALPDAAAGEPFATPLAKMIGALNDDDPSVCRLALVLFDQSQTLHDLGEDSRVILGMAARLCGTPIPHARKKPFKAALAMVRAQADRSLSEDDQATLAAVLAFHQGKLKRKEISNLDLSPVQMRQVLTIAALLRIAWGLDSRGSGQTVIQKVRQGDDRLWIVVDGPEAAADAAAAQQGARLWRRIGYPKATVLEAGEAAIRLAPFPEPTEKIGLTSDDPLAEAGRKALRFQFARMLSMEEAARMGEDIEGVHDMRVATRRLRAAFEVFEDAFEPGALKIYRNGLRQAGRALGKVRDLDVLIDNGRHYRESLPPERGGGMDLLLQAWEAQREQARAEMLDYLNGKDFAVFKRKFNIFLNTPGAGVRPVPDDQPKPVKVRDLAPVLIYQRLAAVRAYGPFLEHAPVEMLHMLRIEFKKLRYTVEYFQEALGRRSREVVETLKLLQDHLGEMNDAEVASGLIEQFLMEMETKQADLPLEQCVNLDEVGAYMAYQLAEREQRITSFPETWRQLFRRPVFRRNLAQAISVL